MKAFFDGPVAPAILKLVLLSFVVGLLFAIAGVDPLDLWRNFGQTIVEVWDMTTSALHWAVRYALLGAIVVVPLWVLYRLIRMFSVRRPGSP